MATVGSDGKFNFWDRDNRNLLKRSEAMEQSISCCAFNHTGQIFAYAVSYDWSKVSHDTVVMVLYCRFIDPYSRMIRNNMGN